ncbi:50S ribosomal protein L14 [Candidatus Nardonella dryophthoridicola]|uniref:Large ribosomal subunit protein uL14 n=1 Tax=endosymbiont of Rhynchophorus ferrugineus TaxID=1972133 RepID=A0A2Z5T3X4_9GAMM|nr:50S ribosomal protein L14 [Candidatus Nardonella dryophthoridicola]QTJ62856.1 50S ribosomal protein L14 [Candidatus Nardonella dryophthoridicola]BBA85101.1 50S ribosomal protein L14 [endosymbiont of Rhynchophorus ferrugineus]
MIQEQTILNVSDNSGAKKVLCIKVLGGSKKKYAFVGDFIKVSIKSINNKSKVKKGDVYKAIVVKTKKRKFRKNENIFINFDINSCVLLNDMNIPIGTRIIGFISKDIKYKGFNKIVSLSNELF